MHIAHQTRDEGERDLVIVEGFVSHVEICWEDPGTARFLRGLAAFSRVILFDKRGVGLSDRPNTVATLEERMDDVLTVMDAVGSERAVLMRISEGAPLALLFAASDPERVGGLILYGGMARSTWAPDYPWAAPTDALIEGALLLESGLFSGDDVDVWAPSMADDDRYKAWAGRYRRSSISPGALTQFFLMFLDIDVRSVLPTIAVPTLVLHRRGDRVVNRRAGEWMASQIPGARYVETPDQDHFPWIGDSRAVVDEVEEFLTGVRHAAEPDRVLATVLFTDIVDSTQRRAALETAPGGRCSIRTTLSFAST